MRVSWCLTWNWFRGERSNKPCGWFSGSAWACAIFSYLVSYEVYVCGLCRLLFRNYEPGKRRARQAMRYTKVIRTYLNTPPPMFDRSPCVALSRHCRPCPSLVSR